MGVLNVTPDSFSDGGLFMSREKALLQVEKMVGDGAAIIDIGGESTRPGAHAVSVDQEMSRVIPIVQAVRENFPVVVSVDTSKPDVMVEAIRAGAGLINDVKALREPGAISAVNDTTVAICLMHMQGEPRAMQQDPHYENVVEEVESFLSERVQQCVANGISRERIIIDPGFGFGKRLHHNLSLLRHLDRFRKMGLTLLVGLSRKSMIEAIVNRSTQDRLASSIALATLAVWQGAHIIRAHDVRETVDALRICDAVLRTL